MLPKMHNFYYMGNKRYTFIFSKDRNVTRYSQEVLSHSIYLYSIYIQLFFIYRKIISIITV